MNNKEKYILKNAINKWPNKGLLSPAEMVNIIAKKDEKAVENLVAKGYLEYATTIKGNREYKNFYRVAGKGLLYLSPWYKKIFPFIKQNYKWIIGAIFIPVGIFVISFLMKNYYVTRSYHYVFQKASNYTLGMKLSKADCWTRAISTSRSDAFRCSSGKYIYDPCFIVPTDNFTSVVVCPKDPHDNNPNIFLADIKRDYQNDNTIKNKNEYPWFIIMRDGSRCNMITGASSVVADMRYDYSCKDGKTTTLLLPIKNKNEQMYIGCLSKKFNAISECSIKEAWY